MPTPTSYSREAEIFAGATFKFSQSLRMCVEVKPNRFIFTNEQGKAQNGTFSELLTKQDILAQQFAFTRYIPISHEEWDRLRLLSQLD